MSNIGTLLEREDLEIVYYLDKDGSYNYYFGFPTLELSTQLSIAFGVIGIKGRDGGNKYVADHKIDGKKPGSLGIILTGDNMRELERYAYLPKYYTRLTVLKINTLLEREDLEIVYYLDKDGSYNYYFGFPTEELSTQLSTAFGIIGIKGGGGGNKYVTDHKIDGKKPGSFGIILTVENMQKLERFVYLLKYTTKLGLARTKVLPKPQLAHAPTVLHTPAYLLVKDGIHSVKSANWFKDFFGVPEQGVHSTCEYTTLEYEPERSKFDYKDIMFRIGDREFNAGDFSCLSLDELKMKNHGGGAAASASGLKSDGSITYENIGKDISPFINTVTQDKNAVFQAASQFNLLEMGADTVSPETGITNYMYDDTQGPRVALASPVGTFFRNYLVYEKTPQTTERQINTLHEVLLHLGLTRVDKFPKIGEYVYKNGYCYINPDGAEINQSMIDNLLRVGIQWNTPLLFDDSRKVCQVYCSALPIAYSAEYNLSGDVYKERITPLAKAVLKSTFKCTLQVGVNKLSVENPRSTVFLTAVGGGVFGNDIGWIAEAVAEAIYEYRDYPLDVKMVGYLKPNPLFSHDIINGIIRSSPYGDTTFKLKRQQVDVASKYLKYKQKYIELKKRINQ